MSRPLYCLLVREGTSDDGLMSPLKALLIDLGFGADSQIVAQPFAGSKRTADVLQLIMDEGQTPDIVFVHRDADNDGYERRELEVHQASEEVSPEFAVVPVVPVKMTEAWVLHALHSPQYQAQLGINIPAKDLPARKTIPNIAAKDRLKQLHDAHFATRGRRKRKHDSRFTTDRARWVEALTNVSFLEGCESFERLRDEILSAQTGL